MLKKPNNPWQMARLLALLLTLLFPLMSPAETEKGKIAVTTSSDEALQSFMEGREAYEMGRINDARILFDKAVREDPLFAMAYLYKAYMAGSTADWKMNLDLADRNSNRVSEGEKILIDIEHAWIAGEPEKRFELAKRLAGLYPGDVRAKLILAGEYQLRKQYTKYRDMANSAILADPGSPLGYRALAVSWLFNLPLDFSLAEKYMQEVVKLRPNEAFPLISLGDAYRASLSLLQAYDAYSAAVKSDPSSGIAFSKRGYVNTYLGKIDEARQDFEMAQSKTGGGSPVSLPNNNLISYFFSGNVKVAAEALQMQHNMVQPASKAQKSATEGQTADHHLCCTVIAMNHGLYTAPSPGADECCCLQRQFTQESFPPDPETIDAHFAFVESTRALNGNDFELAAKKAEEHALLIQPDKNPGKLQVYNYLMGSIHLRQNQYQRAVSHFLKSDLSNDCVKYELGLAYDQLGEFEKAKEVMADVSGCNFTSSYKPFFVERSQQFLRKVAMREE